MVSYLLIWSWIRLPHHFRTNGLPYLCWGRQDLLCLLFVWRICLMLWSAMMLLLLMMMMLTKTSRWQMLSRLNSAWNSNETFKYEPILSRTSRELHNIHKKVGAGGTRATKTTKTTKTTTAATTTKNSGEEEFS